MLVDPFGQKVAAVFSDTLEAEASSGTVAVEGDAGLSFPSLRISFVRRCAAPLREIFSPFCCSAGIAV